MQQQMTGALSVLLVSTMSWGDLCPGDLNADWVVDQQDLGVLLGYYGWGDGGDVDGDGDTDQADLGLLLANYGEVCEPPIGMVFVPEGEFAMGDHSGVGEPDELPVHDVYVDAFAMDVYEVTNEHYADYLNDALTQGLIEVIDGVVYKAGDSEPYCNTFPSSNSTRIIWDGNSFTVTPGKEIHPMLQVSWYGAVAYANWRSSEEGRQPSYDLGAWECDHDASGYRLPTEAEWEYAARGGERTPYYEYPWGDAIDGSMANYSGSGDPYEGDSPGTAPVGYYDGGQTPPGTDMANGYGLYDMAGNVWEWCNDWYDEDYYSSSPYDDPWGPAGGNRRVIRGGSWYDDYVGNTLRCAFRHGGFPDEQLHNIGFRLALD